MNDGYEQDWATQKVIQRVRNEYHNAFAKQRGELNLVITKKELDRLQIKTAKEKVFNGLLDDVKHIEGGYFYSIYTNMSGITHYKFGARRKSYRVVGENQQAIILLSKEDVEKLFNFCDEKYLLLTL